MKKTLIIAAIASMPMAASAAIVTNGSFEVSPGVVSQGASGTNHGKGRTFENMPSSTGGQSWGIWTALPGWTTTSEGIELQTEATLNPDLAADDGEYYAELDTLDNTTISQTVSLGAGDYKLSFAYAPRVANAASNGITVTLGSLIFDAVTDSYTSGTRSWTDYTYSFTVASAGDYDLTFSGVGPSNSRGGLLDDVAISAVPLPAGFLLLGTALGGLGLMRRRQKS